MRDKTIYALIAVFYLLYLSSLWINWESPKWLLLMLPYIIVPLYAFISVLEEDHGAKATRGGR